MWQKSKVHHALDQLTSYYWGGRQAYYCVAYRRLKQGITIALTFFWTPFFKDPYCSLGPRQEDHFTNRVPIPTHGCKQITWIPLHLPLFEGPCTVDTYGTDVVNSMTQLCQHAETCASGAQTLPSILNRHADKHLHGCQSIESIRSWIRRAFSSMFNWIFVLGPRPRWLLLYHVSF